MHTKLYILHNEKNDGHNNKNIKKMHKKLTKKTYFAKFLKHYMSQFANRLSRGEIQMRIVA